MTRPPLAVGLALGVAVCACGDSQTPPATDAAADAETLRGLVTVQFLSNDDPSGYEVYFQNADSSLVLATHTLDDGTANAFMEAGGFVTVGSTTTLWTFSGVQPGDHLVIDRRSGGGQQTSFRLRLPMAPAADSIDLLTPCGTANATFAQMSPVPVALGNCRPGLDLIALVRVGFDPTVPPTSYLALDSAPLVPQQTLTVPGPYRPIDTSTIAVTNAPFSGVRVSESIAGTHGIVYSVSTAGQATEGAITLTDAIALAPGMRLLTDVTSTDFTDALLHHVVKWAPTQEGVQQTDIDLGERVHALASTPQYDPTSSSITWTEDAAGVQPDAVLAALNFHFSNTWWIAGAHADEPRLRIPVLPGTAHELTEPISVFDLVTIAVDGGYPAIRAHLAGWQPTQDPWPLSGSSGHAVYSRPSGLGPLGPGVD